MEVNITRKGMKLIMKWFQGYLKTTNEHNLEDLKDGIKIFNELRQYINIKKPIKSN